MSFFKPVRLLRVLLNSFIRFIGVIIAVSIIAFILVSMSPIDPVQAYVGEIGFNNISAETMQKLQSYFGLDVPRHERYLNWFSDFVKGDMGTSLIYRQAVATVISDKVLNSLLLMLTAWIISGFLGFVLGIIAGLFQGKIIDHLVKGYALLLISTPPFWLALLILIVFSVQLQLFPIGLSVPIGINASQVTILDSLKHLFLPALTLSIIGVANITLHTREKMIAIMAEDYFVFARARGQNLVSIVKHHGLRNIMFPAITLQFASLSEIFGGSVLIEQVFSYPGLGQAAVESGLRGDIPLLLGIAVISAAFVFCGNTIANISYLIFDPRIRRTNTYE